MKRLHFLPAQKTGLETSRRFGNKVIFQYFHHLLMNAMKKIAVVVFLLVTAFSVYAQNVPSPEQFLGYKAGTHFTPHWKLLAYFKAVADAAPNMVKIEKYGETYEGRDLEVAYIAQPDNLQRLDAIRLNNLRMAGLTRDKMAPVTDGAPAIVWLSYNVHGNEPASSEAAMLTLFALVDPANTTTKEYLKNTVIVIDPCINPDGRDRYVNWYNTTVGATYNPDIQAREHAEPWPQGRTNHYNFDLNRDWAWQTQKESQQRLKLYNQWLPEVHVDFHEQGYNAPYYFAPAAAPYHEVITQWQKDFQVMIGKNNAKYFDNNGWLFFTKEEFDLFYPSYGDTYPIYSGSIGMTFEQGGIGAGLGVQTRDGDTLTLVERALHHYTTSISTIETASKNAGKLVTEFKKFFDDNRSGAGFDYKTYVLTANDPNKLAAVADLLQKNSIEYGTATAKTFRGINYASGKDEAYSDEGYQLAVTTNQPKGKLVKVLFEPKSYLSDSNTYDITAWSLPYVYGVNAWEVKEKLDIGPYNQAPAVTTVQSPYGLLIPYTSLNDAQLLGYLLQKKVKVRYSLKPFTYNGKNYDRGTLIILKGHNGDDWNAVTNEACKMFNVQADEVTSGFMEKGADFGSSDVRFIHAPRVALLTGNHVSSSSAGEVWNFFDQTLRYPVTLLNAENAGYYNLSNYDVLILPDGNYSAFDSKNGAEKLQEFVRGGGKIITMESGVNVLTQGDWGLKEKETDDNNDSKSKGDSDYSALKKYGDQEKEYLTSTVPGAIYKVDLDNTHPLAFGYPNTYYTLKQDNKIYQFLKDGWNVGVIKQAAYTSGFVGSKVKPSLKNGLIIGALEYGRGNAVFFADDVLFRMFWQNGKLLFANAVFLVGQ
ncbi:MAG TPA: M14 family metallopeptidase [Chitinophagaceae bacterium]|nr:M14 family metallopeptidase [Chitinophagaceae bacterium]